MTVQHLDGTVQKVNDRKIKPAHGWLKEDFEAAKKGVYPNSLPSRPDVPIREVWDEENVITVDIVPPLRMALRDAMCPALEDPELKLPARPADTLMSQGHSHASRALTSRSSSVAASSRSPSPVISRAQASSISSHKTTVDLRQTAVKEDPLLRGRIRRPPRNLLDYGFVRS